MMRAPVLPQTRERLWPVIATRLDAIESGLELVLEGLDCSAGQHGCVDGLARDGTGAPVLVILAVEGDALLVPRVLSASDFLGRVGDALVTAVPEGCFCRGAAGRLLVIGTDSGAAGLRAVRCLDLPALHVCRLEPFRLAGSERFAVSWLDTRTTAATMADATMVDGDAGAPAAGGTAAAFDPHEFDEALTGEQDEHWRAIVRLCERLDHGVRIDGDRLRRRITWQGRPLGVVTCVDGTLRATAADGSSRAILDKGDVRSFGDRLVRRYAELAGLRRAPDGATDDDGASPPRTPAADRTRNRTRPMARAETLRSAMSEALLSPEEFAALAEPSDPAVTEDSPD